MSQKIHVGDVIEYQPRVGRPRIVEVTKIYVRGFDAVHVGNRYIKSFGYFHQVIRVHRSAGHEDVNHKTKTVGKGDTFVAWQCECGHSEVGLGKTQDEAMHDARLQQRHHMDAARDVA